MLRNILIIVDKIIVFIIFIIGQDGKRNGRGHGFGGERRNQGGGHHGALG